MRYVDGVDGRTNRLTCLQGLRVLGEGAPGCRHRSALYGPGPQNESRTTPTENPQTPPVTQHYSGVRTEQTHRTLIKEEKPDPGEKDWETETQWGGSEKSPRLE